MLINPRLNVGYVTVGTHSKTICYLDIDPD